MQCFNIQVVTVGDYINQETTYNTSYVIYYDNLINGLGIQDGSLIFRF